MSILHGYPSPITPDLTINVLDSRHQFIFKQKKNKKEKTETVSESKNPCICGLWSPFINPIIAALHCLAGTLAFLPRAFVRCVYDSNYIQTIILNDTYDRSTKTNLVGIMLNC